jgi:hypothetical protein
MNFRPTWIKSIVSVLAAIIIGRALPLIEFSGLCYGGCPPFFTLGFWISLILIYLIWSLIQKKR